MNAREQQIATRDALRASHQWHLGKLLAAYNEGPGGVTPAAVVVLQSYRLLPRDAAFRERDARLAAESAAFAAMLQEGSLTRDAGRIPQEAS